MPSGKKEDLVGQTFGRYLLISRTVKNKRTYYLCECSCVNKTRKLVRSDSLKDGSVISCGCFNSENASRVASEWSKTHGKSKTKIYSVYNGMKSRCYNPNDEKTYADYGGRGIIVCNEWLGIDGFMNFYDWSMENGYSEELSIDRINVNGNYEPNNCKWSTFLEQADNKRTTVRITIDGETKTCREWEKEYDLPKGLIRQRYKLLGIEGKDLLLKPKPRLVKQSGVKGVSWHTKYSKWRVAININKKKKHIGFFEDLEDAIRVRESYINNKVKEAN